MSNAFEGTEHDRQLDEALQRHASFRRRMLVLFVVLSAVPAIVAICMLLRAHLAFRDRYEGLPLNVRLTAQAWDNFNRENYASAIARADECISQFKGKADQLQSKLTAVGVSLPEQTVTSNEPNAVLSSGLLNDVATAFYIKGWAKERVAESAGTQTDRSKLEAEAIAAYEAATRYSFARCKGRDGKLWSPAEAALPRLRYLKRR